jgi:hypothetical protein
MECGKVRSKVSAYMDGSVSEDERREMRLHLSKCGTCSAESERYGRIRAALRSLPPYVPPPELAVRLRVIASRERARAMETAPIFKRWRDSFQLSLQNLMRPLALPLFGGICSAVLLFSALVPSFTQHQTPGDVPTGLSTQPLVKSMAPLGFTDAGDAVVDLRIDGEGRIVNYSIIGADGQQADQVRRSIENNLLFTTFQPATAFGLPIAGTIRLSFRSSRIEVRG